MRRIQITLSNGRTVEFEVDVGGDGPACFALSVRKCGSTIFNQMCAALARRNKRHVVHVAQPFFHANVRVADYINEPSLRDLMHVGNVYAGFRNMPAPLCGHEVFEKGLKVLMIRDPRDALVSLYFSTAFSHPVPVPKEGGSDEVARTLEKKRAQTQRMSIEEFVKSEARGMLKTMQAYGRIIHDPTLTVLRYEDYIDDKRALLLRVAECFGWETDERSILSILRWADVRPSEENPRQFIRKVTPGDHKEKLGHGTIAEITEILRPSMDMFGYT